MSTEETFETNAAPCPCGKGQITRVVISPDNPWSRVDISFRVDCVECSGVWIANPGYLEHASDKKIREQYFEDLIRLDDKLQELLRDGVNAYFANFKDMAKQHREMIKLKLSPPNLVDYRKSIKRGNSPADCCRLTGNSDWVFEIADEMGVISEATNLIVAYRKAERGYTSVDVRTYHFDR